MLSSTRVAAAVISRACRRSWRPAGALALLLAAAAPAGAGGGRVVDGLAVVQEDGSLSVAGEKVWLHGAAIPLFVRTCTSVVRPPRCGPRSVLVLSNLVTGFVRCAIVRRHEGSLEGVCTQAGRDAFGPRDDLAATMIRQGWALATPEAPPDYRALEAIARSQEVGIWGPKIVNIR